MRQTGEMTSREFEKLAVRLRPLAVAVAERIVADRQLAEDVAQETLLRLWQLRERLEQYRSVEALARVMARNIAIDEMRHCGRTVAMDEAEAVNLADRQMADRAILESEAQMRLDAVMASLPASQRMVLTMRHADGLELGEIARLTGTSEANVRVILCRTRAKVKEKLMGR